MACGKSLLSALFYKRNNVCSHKDQTHLAGRLTGIVIWIVLIALPVQPDSVINELHRKVDLKVVSFLVCKALPKRSNTQRKRRKYPI
jgi:hypothetical protein